jgi:hypothetical protein
MKQLVYFLLFVLFLFSCGNDEDVKPSSTDKTIIYKVDNLSSSDMKITLYYTNKDGDVDKQIVEDKTLGALESWEKTITVEKQYKLIVLRLIGTNYRIRANLDQFSQDKTYSSTSSLYFATQE